MIRSAPQPARRLVAAMLVTCGDPDVVTGVASVTVAVSPASTTTTPSVTPTTAAAPAAAQTTAAFTG